MNKKEFKNAYGNYRRLVKESRGTIDMNQREWVAGQSPAPCVSTPSCDILQVRLERCPFAAPKRRNGNYGWRGFGWHLGKSQMAGV